MAFPTTGILDDFNRADGPVGSAWSDPLWQGVLQMQVVSNHLEFSAVDIADGYWNASTFGPDCEVYATVVSFDTRVNMFLRIAQPGASTVDGYRLLINGSTVGVVYRLDDGVSTKLGADVTWSFASGDSLGFEAVGSTLTVYQKTGGSWASVDNRSDATYSSAGYLGLLGSSTTAQLDDFGGGTIATASLYTVINGTQSQLVNVNAGGADVDAMTYKASVTLTDAEAATLASTAGVIVTADASPQQMRLIIKRVIRNAST